MAGVSSIHITTAKREDGRQEEMDTQNTLPYLDESIQNSPRHILNLFVAEEDLDDDLLNRTENEAFWEWRTILDTAYEYQGGIKWQNLEDFVDNYLRKLDHLNV